MLYRVSSYLFSPFSKSAPLPWTLLHDAPLKERLSQWLTGFAFVVMAVTWLNRLIEAFTLPYGQLSVLQVTASGMGPFLCCSALSCSRGSALCS